MKAKRELALVLMVLSLAALACNAVQNLPRVVVVYATPTMVVPTPTPESGSQKPGGGNVAPQPSGDPTLGLNRARPFAYANIAHAPDWDYEVLEVLRDNGETFDRPSIIRFPGEKLDARLFPGGELEGWLALWLPVDDPKVVLVFDENIFDKVYFSLHVTEE